MDAVRELKKAGLTCGVHMMPVIPLLTDSARDMEAVFAAAQAAGADYVLAGGLNLKSATRRGFFEAVRQRFPSLYDELAALYADRAAWRSWQEKTYKAIQRLRAQYKMPSYITLREKPAAQQLSFL